uniref:Uncharacterized protein n=1 Tax=Takifugu rubripes TaxID=31033 RepID=A0A674NMY9_TAKRU
MIPSTIIDLSHVQQEIQAAADLGVLLAAGSIFAFLGFAMSKENKTIRFCLWGLKRYGVQGWHVLTLVGDLPLDFHFRVHDPSQSRQLKTNVIVLVHNLE